MTTLNELNCQILLELDRYNPSLKHTASGSNGRHPLLRLYLLREIADTIRIFGLNHTTSKLSKLLTHYNQNPAPLKPK